MAKTPSNMLALGTQAPEFKLPDTVSGEVIALNDVRGEKGVFVAFICNHCPFVKHLKSELAALVKEYQAKGIGAVAISSNDIENYPDDAPEKMKADAEEFGYSFPYLYDESQEVAKAYEAACTPDFYLFDANLKLVYRGQFDDSRPGNDIPVTGEDLGAAMEALTQGNDISPEQKPSIGCNIKWKA